MELLAIGKIGSSHGVAGFMKVVSFSGETGHFFDLDEAVIVKGRLEKKLRIEKVKPYKAGSVLIKFGDVDSPEKGRTLTNGELRVPRANCAPLDAGEFYIADLCGCRVMREGEIIGTVVAVCDGSQSELLEVQQDGKNSMYIPFMHCYVGEVDTENKTIELLSDFDIG